MTEYISMKLRGTVLYLTSVRVSKLQHETWVEMTKISNKLSLRNMLMVGRADVFQNYRTKTIAGKRY